jgi:hypothetical protein
VALRTYTVTYCDLKGVGHSVEVTAASLYEAVAQGLRVFRENDWADDIGGGRTTITVVVRQPRVEHKVRVQDFEQWLEGHPRSPAEMTLKNRLREIMGRPNGKT